MPNKNKTIVIAAHKFLTQPDDDLVIYLTKEKYSKVAHITHGFPDAKDRVSKMSFFENGELVKESRSIDLFGFPEPLIYIKEFISTVIYLVGLRTKIDLYIGMDGLLVFFGLILKRLGLINKVVYWAMDFVPTQRFTGPFGTIKNYIYSTINKYGYTHSDEMWDISPRMIQARQELLQVSASSYKMSRLVPYGVWTSRISKIPYANCEKNTLVFMGHLLEKQGVQIVLQALPDIVAKIPDFKFKIIGTGRYENDLRQLAEKLGVSSYCSFLGKIESDIDLENEIAKSCVAIAPYVAELDKWTYYADPGKVKKYLACGVPVLLTDVPWNAKDIESSRCGKIITTDKDSIVNGILDMMSSGTNQEFRENAIKYSFSYDYQVMFDNLFEQIKL